MGQRGGEGREQGGGGRGKEGEGCQRAPYSFSLAHTLLLPALPPSLRPALVQSLNHENIVELFSVFRTDRTVYIVQELCAGGVRREGGRAGGREGGREEGREEGGDGWKVGTAF